MATEKETTTKTKAKEKEQERVKVRINRASEHDDEDVFVQVNGKAYIFPKGKDVMVPPEIKAELDRSTNAKEHLYQTMNRMASKK